MTSSHSQEELLDLAQKLTDLRTQVTATLKIRVHNEALSGPALVEHVLDKWLSHLDFSSFLQRECVRLVRDKNDASSVAPKAALSSLADRVQSRGSEDLVKCTEDSAVSLGLPPLRTMLVSGALVDLSQAWAVQLSTFQNFLLTRDDDEEEVEERVGDAMLKSGDAAGAREGAAGAEGVDEGSASSAAFYHGEYLDPETDPRLHGCRDYLHHGDQDSDGDDDDEDEDDLGFGEYSDVAFEDDSSMAASLLDGLQNGLDIDALLQQLGEMNELDMSSQTYVNTKTIVENSKSRQ